MFLSQINILVKKICCLAYFLSFAFFCSPVAIPLFPFAFTPSPEPKVGSLRHRFAEGDYRRICVANILIHPYVPVPLLPTVTDTPSPSYPEGVCDAPVPLYPFAFGDAPEVHRSTGYVRRQKRRGDLIFDFLWRKGYRVRASPKAKG